MADASDPPEDIEVKVATDAAERFVNSYYPALNNPQQRSTLASYYIQSTEKSPLKPDITMNGAAIADPSALQALFEKDVTMAQYEVGSFDCQVLNSNFNIGADESMLGPDKDGKKMSILVMVSGSVRYWKEGGDGEMRAFSETVVLVPNWATRNPKAAKGEKHWLIQSQNFRTVV